MRTMSRETYVRLSAVILQPFLLSLSRMFPVSFPSSWITHPPTDAPRFSSFVDESRSLRFLFMEMCLLVSGLCDRGDEKVNIEQAVERIATIGENIYSRLFGRRRAIRNQRTRQDDGFRVGVIRIIAQIEEMRGYDTVFCRVRSQLEDISRGVPTSYTPSGLCKFACSVGLVKRMRAMAVSFRVNCTLKRGMFRYLDELILRLDRVVAMENGVALAVAMALHSRLGASSMLAMVGADLLPLCIPVVICKPIGGWHDLLD
jgi:hypothetical protein